MSLSLPSVGGLPTDRWVLGAGIVSLVALAVMAWLFWGITSEREELEVALDEAVQDSVRYADLIARTNQLTARRDSIAEKVTIINDLDQGRFVWPHVLDEVARALPDYTWLTSVTQVAGGSDVAFRVDGNAGNNFALTVFMEQLEASPFISNVRLLGSQQTVVSAGSPSQQVVSSFQLEARYVQPPMEFLQTTPLFGDGGPPAVPTGAEGAPEVGGGPPGAGRPLPEGPPGGGNPGAGASSLDGSPGGQRLPGGGR